VPPPPVRPFSPRPHAGSALPVVLRPSPLAVAESEVLTLRDRPISLDSGESMASVSGLRPWKSLVPTPRGRNDGRPMLHRYDSSFVERRGTLRVLVDRGHALTATDYNGSSDPYVILSVGAIGLDWVEASPNDERPDEPGSRELFCTDLQYKIRQGRGHASLNYDELWACGFDDLSTSCYIEVDGLYYRPKDTRQQLRTKTRPRSCDPTWDEELTFEECLLDDIVRSGLRIEIFDADRFTRDDFLGGTQLRLGFLEDRNHHSCTEPMWPRPSKWKETAPSHVFRQRRLHRHAIEVRHRGLREALVAHNKRRGSRGATHTVAPHDLLSWGIEHCGKHAYVDANGMTYCPEGHAQGTLEFSVRWMEATSSLNEDIATLGENIQKAYAALSTIAAPKVLYEGMQRASLRKIAEGLDLDGDQCTHAALTHTRARTHSLSLGHPCPVLLTLLAAVSPRLLSLRWAHRPAHRPAHLSMAPSVRWQTRTTPRRRWPPGRRSTSRTG
jgi:hypothetical protein